MDFFFFYKKPGNIFEKARLLFYSLNNTKWYYSLKKPGDIILIIILSLY